MADPGGKVAEDIHRNNKIITNRTNGISVNSFLKATTKDQLPSTNFSPNNIIATAAPTATATSALNHNNNTTNDSKYLHKKFKKFCATVDSNQNNNINFNHNTNSSHNSDRTLTLTSANTATTTTSCNSNNNTVVITGLLNNNNSEIVENKNNSSWIQQQQQPRETTNSLRNQHNNFHNHNHQQHQQLNQFQSVPSSTHQPPKHLQTTEEEKQLVKDIIDINNENFMHQNQSANHSLNLQNSSSFLITNSSSGLTVTTLGNHNSNFQTSGDTLRQHKVISSQEPAYNNTSSGSSNNNQLPNGNFVIINNQAPIDYHHQNHQTAPSSVVASSSSTATSVTNSSVPTTSSATNLNQTPGRYICPYCQLNCAKPSVLQKHIRAHTNERPFPCTPCGFAFKTKSNLYKHCR